MSGKKINISIPIQLYKKIKEKTKETNFSSVSEYIVFILRELLTEENVDKNNLNEEEENQIKSRLKTLGYFEE